MEIRKTNVEGNECEKLRQSDNEWKREMRKMCNALGSLNYLLIEGGNVQRVYSYILNEAFVLPQFIG